MAFVTGAFPIGAEYRVASKRWIAVVHRFSPDGEHLGSESRLGGFDEQGREVAGDRACEHLARLCASLTADGEPTFGDIRVRPFAVEIDGVRHGLIYERDPDDPESEYVMLEPRDIMFHPPWDGGEYST